MLDTKRRSTKQEKRVAKEVGGRVTAASGALSVLVVSGTEFIVDTEDLPFLSQYYLKSPDGTYVLARERMCKGRRKSTSLGRLLLGVDDPNILVDHKDRNTRNYSKSNLRACTRSQNQSNRVMKVTKTSKYRGVNYSTSVKDKPWKVSIKVNGKTIHGGYFKSELLAALRYNELALEYFGDYAVLNKVVRLRHEK